MKVNPTQSDDGAETERLASLEHRHRNLIQNMHSLVGLAGRNLPEGRCRNAFKDLRARFEALTPLSHETPRDDTVIEADLGALAERLGELLDPARQHRVAVRSSCVRIAARRVAAVRQLLGEMTIALYRQGLAGAGGGEIAIGSGENGDISIRLSAHEPSGRPASVEGHDLWWSIAHELARALDATIETPSIQPFVIEARIPATDSGR